MFGLALGVQQISSTLPDPIYALLSGLNAATVGIVAVAAVQLAERAIKDKMSRIIVVFGACAGLCYSALWYFPVLVVAGGIATAMWDLWLAEQVSILKRRWHERKVKAEEPTAAESQNAQDVGDAIELQSIDSKTQQATLHRRRGNPSAEAVVPVLEHLASTDAPPTPTQANEPDEEDHHFISPRIGLAMFTIFMASFIAVMVARSKLSGDVRPFKLFANVYLAGLIIFVSVFSKARINTPD